MKLKHGQPKIPPDGKILFFKRDREAFPFLSNFYYAPFLLDGQVWPTVEHYYQAQKSTNPQYHSRVLKKRPAGWVKKLIFANRCFYGGGHAKRVGDSRVGDPKISKQSWFRSHPEDLRADWNDVKLEVMRQAVAAKFGQNEKLRRRLIDTAEAILVEDSEKDSFWGLGPDGSGENQLGRVLMEARSVMNDN